MPKTKEKRKGRKLEIPAGAVYALLAATALICVTVLAVVIAGPTDEGIGEPPQIKVPHLFIDDVFFRGVETNDISLLMTVYITNDGTADAGEVKVDVWPIVKESNIATTMVSVPFGTIPSNETSSEEAIVGLKPSTVHSVELRIFESGKLVLKGRAFVSTTGSGGGDYATVEVRGTTDDSDYDGMPDSWERYYGLDPTDGSDGDEDKDRDGVSNVDEYRLNRAPASPPKEEKNDILEPLFDEDTFGDGGASPSVAVGAMLFLLLIVGTIVVLIYAAVRSHRKAQMEEERRNAEAPKAQRETSAPLRKPDEPALIVHEVRDGHEDESRIKDIESFLYE